MEAGVNGGSPPTSYVVGRFNLPRVSCRAQGLLDASVAHVLRWATRAHRVALARAPGEVWGTLRSATSPRF